MPLARDPETFAWTIIPSDEDAGVIAQSHASYIEALPKTLTDFDRFFERAKWRSEFNFIWTLLGIRGMQDQGWDPFESSVTGIDSIRSLIPTADAWAQRHLALWVYGHIMEASEPYEMLANMVAIGSGESFHPSRFEDLAVGRNPPSPGRKIQRLRQMAAAADVADGFESLDRAWDRKFRNAIFHADYALHGLEVRIMEDHAVYDHDATMTLVNRALAYLEAIRRLRTGHVESYDEPVIIPVPESFGGQRPGNAWVVVKEGHGVVGMRAADGGIPWECGRYTAADRAFIQANPGVMVLPAEPESA